MLTKLSKTLLIATTAMAGLSFGASNATQPDCQMPDTLTQDGNEVYQIETCGDLYKFADMVNNGQNEISARLTADIRVNGSDKSPVLNANGTLNDNGKNFIQWIPIGTEQSPFLGNFDGNGHIVSGLYINNKEDDSGLINEITSKILNFIHNDTLKDNALTKRLSTIMRINNGLFGDVGTQEKGVTIKNLGIEDSYFYGGQYSGGIAAHTKNTSITNCYNTSTVTGETSAGGLVGLAENSIVSTTYNAGFVLGGSNTGGIIGQAKSTKVKDSYSLNPVSAGKKNGGLVGDSEAGDINGAYIINYTNQHATGNSKEDGNATAMTIMELTNGKIPKELSDSNWLPGSSSIDVNSVATFNIPSLKTFAEQSKPKVYGTLSITFKNAIFNNKDITLDNVKSVKMAINGTALSYSDIKNLTLSEENNLYNSTLIKGTFDGINFETANNQVFFPKKDADGTEYYEISKPEHLNWFATLVNSGNGRINGKLTADIRMNGSDKNPIIKADGSLNGDSSSFIQWTPIGTPKNSYSGTFDGDGHTISGLYIKNPETNYAGLFGYIGTDESSATIKNVRLINSYIHGKKNVGGLVGESINSTIINGYCSSSVIGKKIVGGLVGKIESGSIEKSQYTGLVSGESEIGGLAGSSSKTSISVSFNSGKVNGSEDLIGGLIGSSYLDNISNCYNMASIHGTIGHDGFYELNGENPINGIGGLVGNASQSTISHCYNNATVDGVFNVGSIVGYSDEASISYTYNNKSVFEGRSIGYGNAMDYEADKIDKKLWAGTDLGFDPEVWVVGAMGQCKTVDTLYYPYLKIFGPGKYILTTNTETIAAESKALKKAAPASEEAKDYGKKEPGLAQADSPQFSVKVSGRTLSISGAQPNTTLDVFDMQGKKVKSEAIHAESFEIILPNVGIYVVKNGYAVKRISVK